MPKLMQHFRKLYSHIQCSPTATLKAVAATHLREAACVFLTGAIPHFCACRQGRLVNIPAMCRSIPSLTAKARSYRRCPTRRAPPLRYRSGEGVTTTSIASAMGVVAESRLLCDKPVFNWICPYNTPQNVILSV